MIDNIKSVSAINAVVPSKSTFATPTPASIAADGVAGSSLKVNLVDSAGSEADAAANASIQVSAERSNAATGEKPIIVTLTKNGSTTGEYVGTFKSTLAGTYTLTASYVVTNGATTQIGSAQQVTTTNAITPNKSTLTVSKLSMNADNVDSVTVTVQLNDGNGDPMATTNDSRVTLKRKLSSEEESDYKVVSLSKVAGATGKYTATFTTTTVGTHQFLAQYDTVMVDSVKTVTAKNAITPSKSTLTVSKDSMSADNSDSVTVTVQLNDSKGATIATTNDSKVTLKRKLSTQSESDYKVVSLTKVAGATGKYTATFTTTTPGTHQFLAQYDSVTVDSVKSVTALNTAVDPSKSSFEVDKTNQTANGSDYSEFTITLRNSDGVAVNGVQSSLTVRVYRSSTPQEGSTSFNLTVRTTAQTGVYKASLPPSTAKRYDTGYAFYDNTLFGEITVNYN